MEELTADSLNVTGGYLRSWSVAEAVSDLTGGLTAAFVDLGGGTIDNTVIGRFRSNIWCFYLI